MNNITTPAIISSVPMGWPLAEPISNEPSQQLIPWAEEENSQAGLMALSYAEIQLEEQIQAQQNQLLQLQLESVELSKQFALTEEHKLLAQKHIELTQQVQQLKLVCEAKWEACAEQCYIATRAL